MHITVGFMNGWLSYLISINLQLNRMPSIMNSFTGF